MTARRLLQILYFQMVGRDCFSDHPADAIENDIENTYVETITVLNRQPADWRRYYVFFSNQEKFFMIVLKSW